MACRKKRNTAFVTSMLKTAQQWIFFSICWNWFSQNVGLLTSLWVFFPSTSNISKPKHHQGKNTNHFSQFLLCCLPSPPVQPDVWWWVLQCSCRHCWRRPPHCWRQPPPHQSWWMQIGACDSVLHGKTWLLCHTHCGEELKVYQGQQKLSRWFRVHPAAPPGEGHLRHHGAWAADGRSKGYLSFSAKIFGSVMLGVRLIHSCAADTPGGMIQWSGLAAVSKKVSKAVAPSQLQLFHQKVRCPELGRFNSPPSGPSELCKILLI